jgi:cytochrome c oxidase subunit 2
LRPSRDRCSFVGAPPSAVRLRRLALPASALLLLTACRFGAPAGATVQGKSIANLYHLMFYIAIGVGGLVYVLIGWCIIRYRRKSEDLPPQTRYHVPLEITYTVIPVLIVLGIFAATYHTEVPIDRVSADPAVTIDVTAFQWQWRFSYPQYGIQVVGTPQKFPTMVVPVGQTVQIDLRAQDVIHAFFVPDFLFKRDAIPGKLNRFDFEVDQPGTYYGECAEFCGLDHADMVFYVKAVSPSQFRAWARSGGSGS